jgi:hypothetical protein
MFLLCSLWSMVGPLPDSLQQLIGFGGSVRVKCRRCGREARFHPGTLSSWFRAQGKRDDWKTIRRKFVCKGVTGEGCGGRDVEVTYELDAPEPPPLPPVPRDNCPDGIDPIAWAKADYHERKRLVRSLR